MHDSKAMVTLDFEYTKFLQTL